MDAHGRAAHLPQALRLPQHGAAGGRQADHCHPEPVQLLRVRRPEGVRALHSQLAGRLQPLPRCRLHHRRQHLRGPGAALPGAALHAPEVRQRELRRAAAHGVHTQRCRAMAALGRQSCSEPWQYDVLSDKGSGVELVVLSCRSANDVVDALVHQLTHFVLPLSLSLTLSLPLPLPRAGRWATPPTCPGTSMRLRQRLPAPLLLLPPQRERQRPFQRWMATEPRDAQGMGCCVLHAVPSLGVLCSAALKAADVSARLRDCSSGCSLAEDVCAAAWNSMVLQVTLLSHRFTHVILALLCMFQWLISVRHSTSATLSSTAYRSLNVVSRRHYD